MNEADRIRIRHMLDAAGEALEFAKGRSADDLRDDRILLLALAKEIEIIGEAATQLSEECRSSPASIAIAGPTYLGP